MFEITIDSREQTPWAFDPTLVHVTRGTVRTGDYCVTGDKGFAVERKSLNDFLGTISTGWERFQREIYRAKDAGFHMPIIVESRFSDILFAVLGDGTITPPQHDHPRLTPGFVLKRIGEIEMLGASVMFADGVTEAAMLAAAILFQRHKELHADED
jgi:hypothetical protein